jgi:DNA mismatch endonuclease, patch repair protein
MVDVHTQQQRSFNMSRIRNRDTRPEKLVRSVIHRLGYRYRRRLEGFDCLGMRNTKQRVSTRKNS